MGVISSRIRRHRRTRLAAEMACTWNPRRLFPLGQEQGGVYYPDDPNALLRRRNLLTYTTGSYVSPWAVDNSGATNPTVTTNYAEAPDGTMTAARVQLNKTGGVFSRLRWVGAWPVGNPYVVSIYACTTSGLGTANVGLRSADAGGTNMAVTGAWQRFSYSLGTITAPADFQLLLWDSIAGNDETADILIWGAQLERDTTASPYQPVTDWNTEYMAAVGHLVTQFTDSAGTTPVTKVTDPVGLTLDRRFGLYRGPQLLTSGAIGLTGAATAATYSTSTGAGTVTRVDASNQSWVQFSGLTAGRSYQITVSGVSGGTLQVRDGSATGTVIASTTSGTPCVVTATGTTITLTASAAATVAFTVTQIQWLPGNHRIQATSGSRKTLSARYNRFIQTEAFDNAAWLKANTTVTAAVGTSPAGSPVCRVQLGSGSAAFLYQDTSVGAMPTAGDYKQVWWIKSNTGGTQTFRLFGDGTLDYSSTLTADTTWQAFTMTGTANGGGSVGLTNAAGFVAADLLVWRADLRTADDAAKAIPAYQRVNTESNYDTDGFYHANVFDGTDDNDTCATGGGNTSGLMLVSTITVQGGAGTNRVIWSDIGTNTGWRVRINTSNQLEISAGNGSAYTTVATTATLPVGETHVISAWEDGANLCVQIDNGAVASTAKPTISAGTAGFTIGKENGTASGYFFGRIYDVVARWSGYNPTEHARLKSWAARLAGMTL